LDADKTIWGKGKGARTGEQRRGCGRVFEEQVHGQVRVITDGATVRFSGRFV
jgi:hypothetical protein